MGQPLAAREPAGRASTIPYGHIGGDPHPIVAAREVQFIPYGAFGATDPDIDSPRVQSWNVTLERQLGEEWGVAASYLGSYTDRLWVQMQQNPGVFLGTRPLRDQRRRRSRCAARLQT